MPNSKAKMWRKSKANELWEKYFNNKTHLPNYNRKRDESPNTAINRKVLKKEMKYRNIGTKEKKSKKLDQNEKIDYNEKYKKINSQKYEVEKNIYLNMNHKKRRAILRAEKKAKLEKKNRKIDLKISSGEYCVKIMELGNDQSWENTRKQYLKLCIKYHPDKNGDEEQFIKLKEAYDILRKHFEQ